MYSNRTVDSFQETFMRVAVHMIHKLRSYRTVNTVVGDTSARGYPFRVPPGLSRAHIVSDPDLSPRNQQ
jgi:hypothetical protein